jgi:hypothetical protein
MAFFLGEKLCIVKNGLGFGKRRDKHRALERALLGMSFAIGIFV